MAMCWDNDTPSEGVHAGGRFRPITGGSFRRFAIAIDDAQLRSAGEFLAKGDWPAAAAAYRAAAPTQSDLMQIPVTDQLRRNLALNMAEIQAARPELFQAICSAPADNRFGIAVTPSGRPTVSFRDSTGKTVNLCDGPDPLAYLAAVRANIKPAVDAGHCLALLGLADGYLLTQLARHPVKYAFGREQCIHVFEPNVANLTMVLMLHDLAGATGPFRQDRFRFWIGRDCTEQFGAGTQADPALPFPMMTLMSAPDGPGLSPRVQAAIDRANQQMESLRRSVHTRARAVTLERLVDATSANPSRPPRVMLLTTRQTTVLQYSTQDLAAAFGNLGWEAKILIEPNAYSALTLPALHRMMLDHDPDLIVQLDHIRAEHRDAFPPEVPFLCWAQDHLPNLTTISAGKSQGPLDFFLTCLGPWFVRRYEYPPESIVPLNKLTRIPQLPGEWSSDGPDLAYVSNASRPPEQALSEMKRAYSALPNMGVVIDLAYQRMLALYSRGEAVHGSDGCVKLITAAAGEAGVDVASIPHELPVDLFERVNNLLYRQQALTWVAETADELGLTLEIYGSGWESHPRFARYARGYVGYGEDLERLTRSARVNLQIVPYSALHQRLLDGLAAGGFFMVREHASDTALPALCRFVRRHVPASLRNLEEAMEALPAAQAQELRRHADANAYLLDRMDALELARTVPEMGIHDDDSELPPRLSEVSFDSKRQFAERLKVFLADADLRRGIMLEQRAAIAAKLSYEAGLRRVLERVHRRIARLAAGSRTAA
jgi:hypothetical protein